MTFETLLYTDCRPGQGLGSGGGLQFQARSSAAAWEASSLVQRCLLYEPPSQWMLEGRPVDDYPLSLAHVWNGYLATARGRYLGQEANGSREGNQVTHALVTKDPEAYGLTRPAQLFGASFWADGPSPTRTSAPQSLDEDLGRFGVEELRDFACADTAAQERLIALLTALDGVGSPDASRVVFVSPDPEPVLRWIAAATLLIPQHRALAIGFKVFTTNPAYAEQPVIAVHPSWATTSTRVGNEAGYTVFDLTTGEQTKVTADEGTARDWVMLFRDSDPYDVVDMVEVAGASALQPETALQLAQAVVLGRTPALTYAADLIDWLGAGPESVVASYGDVLVGTLMPLISRMTLETLRSLDAITSVGRFPDRGAPVRMALVRAEIVTAARKCEVADGTVAPVAAAQWSETDEAERVDAFRVALGGATGQAFEALLRLLSRHRFVPSTSDLAALSARFITDWADHPEHGYSARDWPGGEILVDGLRDELIHRLEQEPGRADRIGDAWLEILLVPDGDPGNPLHAALLSAAMVHPGTPVAKRVVSEQLARAGRSADPAAAFRLSAGYLWRRRPATTEELGRLGKEAPAGATLTGHAVSALVEDAGTADPAVLAVCRALVDRRLFRHPEIEQMIADDRFAAGIGARLRSAGRDELPVLADRLDRLHLGVWIWRERTLVATVEAAGPVAVALLVRGFPKDIRNRFITRLAAAVVKGADPLQVADAFAIYGQQNSPEEVQTQLGVPFEHWVRTTKPRMFDDVGRQVIALFGLEPRYEGLWSIFVDKRLHAAAAKKETGWIARGLRFGSRTDKDR